MQRFTKAAFALLTVALTTVTTSVASEEPDAIARIDRDLVRAATYLDIIRNDELATRQVVEKAAEVLVTLAGQRNALVAGSRATARWREVYRELAAEQEALERTFERARHRLGAYDAAKTRGVLRRRRALLKGMASRIAEADAARDQTKQHLLRLTGALVEQLESILRAHGYDAEVEERDERGDGGVAHAHSRSGDAARVAGYLRKLRSALAHLEERVTDLAALRTRAYARLAKATPQFIDTLNDLVQDCTAGPVE